MHKNQFILFTIGLLFLISSCSNYHSFRIVKNSNKIEQKHENNSEKVSDFSSIAAKSDLVQEEHPEQRKDFNKLDSIASRKSMTYFQAKDPIRSTDVSAKINRVGEAKVSAARSVKKNDVEELFSWVKYAYLIIGFVLLTLIILIIVSALAPYPLLLNVCLYALGILIVLLLLNLIYVQFS